MDREIIAVFQDCVLCGDKGRRKVAELADRGVIVRKVGFTTDEGRDLCNKAVLEHGIKSMPFYTDGERFAAKLTDLIDNPKKTAKRVKKTKTKEKDGDNS